MYTQIKNPAIALYDEEGNLTGVATFQLTSESEEALLNFVNNGTKLSSLTLLDVDLYGTKYYEPPAPFASYDREGTLYTLLLDSLTGRYTPVAIKFKFKLRTRGNLTGSIYHFDSADYNDIQIESVNFFH